MSDERCLPYRENLSAYALGALDAEEIPALEAHLSGCKKCQAELADYQSVTSGLLQSIPPLAPPRDLRNKLVQRLPAYQKRTSPSFNDIFGRFSFGQAALVLVVLALLGLNVYSNLQILQLRQQQTMLADRVSRDQAAIALLAYPETEFRPVQADAENVAGSMLVDVDKNTAVLVLWNLPQLAPNQTYQVWLVDANQKRLSGGLFRPVTDHGYTTVTIQSPRPLGEFVGVGVTVEPEGGSPGPTSPRVFGVDL